MLLTLRPVREPDADLLLAWRNDPEVRAASFSQHVVSEQEHRDWLTRKVRDPGCRLYVVEESGEPIGHVRLDRLAPGRSEVSISIAAAVRGRGFGRRALDLAMREAGERLGAEVVIARVKEDNERSLKAFVAAGFAETSREGGVVTLSRAVDQRPVANRST